MRAPTLRPAIFRWAARVRTWPPVLLGAFILWQLLFIPLANLLDFFPHRPYRFDELTDMREVPVELVQAPLAVHALSAITDRWTQATGQNQMWWLFAPEFPPQATFPVVELHWNDPALRQPPVHLHSSLEPADTADYFRPPGASDRLFQYEMHLGLGLVYWDKATAAADQEAWQKHFRDVVRSQWKSMRAYLRCRTNEFLAQHPELPPPDEARLSFRLYCTPALGTSLSDRSPPTEQPFARWRLNENHPAEFLPVEAYDPFRDCFVLLPLPLGEGRGEGGSFSRGSQNPHPNPLPKGEGTAGGPHE